MWTLHKQPQHCGAQLHARDRRSPGSAPRQPGEAPDEAIRDRAAQEHDRAGDPAQPGEYPASRLENRDGGDTPTAPGDAPVEWDDIVQPERRQPRRGDWDDLPLPEQK